MMVESPAERQVPRTLTPTAGSSPPPLVCLAEGWELCGSRTLAGAVPGDREGLLRDRMQQLPGSPEEGEPPPWGEGMRAIKGAEVGLVTDGGSNSTSLLPGEVQKTILDPGSESSPATEGEAGSLRKPCL